MDRLEDLKISPLSFNFILIYIIHKMLVLLKKYLNYLNDSICKYFFEEYNIHFCYPKIYHFFYNIY